MRSEEEGGGRREADVGARLPLSFCFFLPPLLSLSLSLSLSRDRGRWELTCFNRFVKTEEREGETEEGARAEGGPGGSLRRGGGQRRATKGGLQGSREREEAAEFQIFSLTFFSLQPSGAFPFALHRAPSRGAFSLGSVSIGLRGQL